MVFPSQDVRSRRLQVIVCAVLLVCILIVVIAPQVDLLPTTLRAQRLVFVLLIQVAVLGLLCMLSAQASHSRLGFISFHETPTRPLLSRLSIICVRRC